MSEWAERAFEAIEALDDPTPTNVDRVTREFDARSVAAAAGSLGANAGGGSQPFTPTDLTGLALWLDASTLTLADDDPVATWPDASTNGFDATQPDADLQPVCKTAVLNGLRVVRFAAGDSGDPDFIPENDHLVLSGAALDMFRGLDGCTIAAVGANPTTVSTFCVLSASVDGDNTLRRVGLEYHGDGVLGIFGSNAEGGSDGDSAQGRVMKSSDPTPPVGFAGAIAFSIGAVALDATVSPVRGANDYKFTDTTGALPDTPSDAIVIGASTDATVGSDCDYAEIIVYQRALNAKERRDLLEYLSEKWATL